MVVVGVEAFGRLALRAPDLRALQLRRDRANDAGGDLILQFEDIVEGAVETGLVGGRYEGDGAEARRAGANLHSPPPPIERDGVSAGPTDIEVPAGVASE